VDLLLLIIEERTRDEEMSARSASAAASGLSDIEASVTPFLLLWLFAILPLSGGLRISFYLTASPTGSFVLPAPTRCGAVGCGRASPLHTRAVIFRWSSHVPFISLEFWPPLGPTSTTNSSYGTCHVFTKKTCVFLAGTVSLMS
jgi:hypothetical protein